MANPNDRTGNEVSLGSSLIIPVGIKFHLNNTQRMRLADLGVDDKGERSEDKQMQRRQEHVDHVGWKKYSQDLRLNATGLRVGASGSSRIVFNKPEQTVIDGEPEWVAARDTAGTLAGLRAQLINLGYTLVDMHLIARHGERRGMCDLTMFFAPPGAEGAVGIAISPELETALAAIEGTYFRSIFVYDNKAAGNMFVVANHVVNKQTNQTGTLFEVSAPSVIKVCVMRNRLRWRHRPQKRRWVPHGITSVVLQVNILPEDRNYLLGLGMTEDPELSEFLAGDLLEVNEQNNPNVGVLASDMIDPLCGGLGFRITEAKLLTGKDQLFITLTHLGTDAGLSEELRQELVTNTLATCFRRASVITSSDKIHVTLQDPLQDSQADKVGEVDGFINIKANGLGSALIRPQVPSSEEPASEEVPPAEEPPAAEVPEEPAPEAPKKKGRKKKGSKKKKKKGGKKK